MIAAAGSGKTTYLIHEALKIKDANVLITTYTEANKEEIEKKFIAQNGCVPRNVTIQTWFSFLLQHGVRPYQAVIDERLAEKRIGFFLTERPSGFRYTHNGQPIYWGEASVFPYYFTKDLKIYSDKISKFVVECNAKTHGEVISRIARIYPYIFIDEVQDLAGWELELIKLFFGASSKVLLVGDPRQVTYLTHHPKKYTKYKEGKIEDFIRGECKGNAYEIDIDTLNRTHRNNKEICDFSSKLFPEYVACEPCGCNNCRGYGETHQGIFLVKAADVVRYCQDHPSTILKEKMAEHPDWNFGKSKGLTFERVLIYPTKPIRDWIINNGSQLEFSSRCKFYVAVTRARHSVAIVYDYDNREFEGLKKWNPRPVEL